MIASAYRKSGHIYVHIQGRGIISSLASHMNINVHNNYYRP